MIETFYGTDTLGSSGAMLVALLVGLAFGFSLERAGFGSSRRLAGIFYFTDMTVLKVMFTALVVALVGMLYLFGAGWIAREQIYFMHLALLMDTKCTCFIIIPAPQNRSLTWNFLKVNIFLWWSVNMANCMKLYQKKMKMEYAHLG